VPENGSHTEKALSLSLEDVGLAAPFDPAGVQASFELQRVFDKVFGRIRAQAQAHLNCSRCLKAFVQPIQADFQIQFQPPASQSEPEEDEDPGFAIALIEDEALPIGEEIRQELELQIPFAPQCRRDCKGLCPRCGQNWNDGDCDCPKGPEGGAFSGLNELLQKKKDP
jgi:uncharacterized metal-binding protein YceD (DUF177 family)